jgi:hypothetical protein
MRPWVRGWFVVCFAAGMSACLGEASLGGPGSPVARADPSEFGDPTSPAALACADSPLDVPAYSLLRLNAEQYGNTAHRLFSTTVPLVLENSSAGIITALEVEKWHDAASVLVATKGHHTYAPCAVSGSHDAACMKAFIRAFGLRVFRRPVSTDEESWLLAVYDQAKNTTGVSPAITFAESLDVVAQVMVQSPQHVYLFEEGVPDVALPDGLRRLTGYERATRLSYLLTQNTPDEALLAAAGSGALDSPEGVRDEAARILATPAGRVAIRRFAGRYLHLNAVNNHPSLETNPKDAVRFPFDSPALRSAMRTESEAFFEDVVFAQDGRFETLLTSARAYVNKSLASLYGVAGPATDSEFAWVSLDASQRGGVLTRAAFLMVKANQNYQSPIHRGVFLLKEALCQPLGPPPPNANNVPAVPGGTGDALSTRQVTELKTAEAMCQACHGTLNPLGFTLENYDAMGRWQVSEAGKLPSGAAFEVPINATSTLTVPTMSGTVKGGVELSRALAASPLAQDCMTQHWFTEVTRREPTTQDTCSVLKLQKSFRESTNLRSLVLDAASAPPALFVRPSL